ncbi:MAG: family 78 glycoside hydrolase catalytic domain [Prevotella sp.]|nr:family 78 glycoside hydrolase catalytic domain [Prevotella sp.]
MKRKNRQILIALVGMLFAVGSAHAQKTIGQKCEALSDAAWAQSQWISVVDAPVVTERADKAIRAADGASWFVATVRNPKPVVEAKWMTTGLGVFELYLNGQLVGEEVLKPGFTHPFKTRRSFTYDVSDAFLKGAGRENVLAAQVTPGWWADKIVTPGDHIGMVGRKCAFRAVLQLTFADGSTQLFGTDCDHWKAGITGPVKHAAIFDGEAYDAREPEGFANPEKLAIPEVNCEFGGEILPSEGAEVYLRRDLALKPVRAYVWTGVQNAKPSEKRKEMEHGKVVVGREYAEGEPMMLKKGETLVVDFGQNCSGVPSFAFKARRGTTLTCLPAELLNDGNGAERRGMDGPEGSVHRRNLRMGDKAVRLDYTFAGRDDFETFTPRLTFFGYRFISVTATDDVLLKSVESVPMTSISEAMETGFITTGSGLINQLISNTIWGQRSNYLSVPTDCPQRDERLGWMADTQVFAETGTFFAATDRFFHKWTRDVRDSQSETGGFPGVAPTAQYGNETMRLGWADAGIIVPWTIWKQFGDVDIINENWTAMERFISHVNETKYDHQALSSENLNYQWADWLSCEALESCINLAFDENWKPRPEAVTYWNYLSACYWQIDAEKMRDMAKATGRNAEKYQKMAENARNYLKETFLNADGSFKLPVLNTMQTPALFALKNGLVEGVARENLKNRLRQNFKDHGDCLQTGFLGTSILMSTLTENGMADLAYELLFQRKNPSWLYSIDNGATTIWERWNSYTIDNGLGPNDMNSFNHYAYGSVCEWIWETVAGIAADEVQPGFRHIVMRPVPDKRLGFVKAEYRSAAGLIKSEWKYDGDSWIWNFTIPEGATASVTLPGETQAKEYQSGSYQITKKNK